MDLACCKTRRVLERLTNIRWGAENVGEQQGLCLKTIFTIVKFTRRIPMEVSKHTGCPVSPGGTLLNAVHSPLGCNLIVPVQLAYGHLLPAPRGH
jgi:hypothetical protein